MPVNQAPILESSACVAPSFFMVMESCITDDFTFMDVDNAHTKSTEVLSLTPQEQCGFFSIVAVSYNGSNFSPVQDCIIDRGTLSLYADEELFTKNLSYAQQCGCLSA